jgi:hypothetical protein
VVVVVVVVAVVGVVGMSASRASASPPSALAALCIPLLYSLLLLLPVVLFRLGVLAREEGLCMEVGVASRECGREMIGVLGVRLRTRPPGTGADPVDTLEPFTELPNPAPLLALLDD